MIEHDSKFTFRCDIDEDHVSLVVEAKTERTAITKAREQHWDIMRVRAVSGAPKNKVTRTVRRCFCPGCAWLVGVTFR